MKAWLFDVDGVITDLKTKEINEPQILGNIVRKLEKREPVALVTGRSTGWLKGQLIPEIKSRLPIPNLKDSFFISGEFGGTSITYKNEKELEDIDQEIIVPRTIS